MKGQLVPETVSVRITRGKKSIGGGLLILRCKGQLLDFGQARSGTRYNVLLIPIKPSLRYFHAHRWRSISMYPFALQELPFLYLFHVPDWEMRLKGRQVYLINHK